MIFHLGHVFLSHCTCYVVRGGALGVHQGGATYVSALWHCMWERGPRGSACSALCQFSVIPQLPIIKLGPSGADSQGDEFM